jgi:hypothetical protein
VNSAHWHLNPPERSNGESMSSVKNSTWGSIKCVCIMTTEMFLRGGQAKNRNERNHEGKEGNGHRNRWKNKQALETLAFPRPHRPKI